MDKILVLCRAGILAALWSTTVPFAVGAISTRSLDETIGVVHSGGRYRVPSLVPTLPPNQWPPGNATEIVSPTDPDRAKKLSYFEEGAYLAKAQVGTRVLKLFANGNMVKGYAGFTPYNPWRTSIGAELAYTSLTDLFDEAPFKNVLDDPYFSVVAINATNFSSHWNDIFNADTEAPYDAIVGVDSSPNPDDWDPWIKGIYLEIKELTTYLLTTYGTQGRTFIIQNWEGDNDVNVDAVVVTYPNGYCGTPVKTPLFPTAEKRQRRVDLFVAWMKARQQAVSDARAAYYLAHPGTTSRVYCGLEINQNPGTFAVGALAPEEVVMRDWCLLNKVVSSVAVDLYSWSNWSITKTLNSEHYILSGLDYFRSRLPANNPHSPELNGSRIFLGEFGCYELKTVSPVASTYTATTDANFSTIIERQMEYAVQWGARYCVQWVLLDNGARSENKCLQIKYDYSDFLYPMQPESSTYQGTNGLYQNALTGVWVIRGAKDGADPRDHSFPYVYGRLTDWLHRKEYADPLTDKNGFSATQKNDFLVANTVAKWNGHDAGRLYLAANPVDPAVIYQVGEDLRDFYVRAYINSTNPDAPIAVSARFKYQVSATTNFSGAPLQDFVILHQDWLDKKDDLQGWNQKNWKAYDLGPSATALPTGMRYLRVVFQSSSSGSNAQLGSVRLYTSKRNLVTDEITVDVNSGTSGHLCEQAVNLAWTAATDANTAYNVGRVWSANTAQSSQLIYRLENIAGFSFRVFHTGAGDTATTLPAHVKAWVSHTGLASDFVPLTLQVDVAGSSPVSGAPGWFSTKAKPANLLLEGARYLIIGLDPTTRGATDTQIASTAYTLLEKP